MCVIVYKPKNSKIRLNTLKACWDANPHGAGIMWADDGKVFGIKGLMKFKDLETILRKSEMVTDDDRVNGDLGLVFHFRLATHGGISPENCHPFPISDDMADLKALHWEDDLGVAHNGVIDIDGIEDGDSDTQTYIESYLAEYKARLRKFDEATLKQVDWEVAPCRLFILRGDGRFKVIGKWFRNDQGVWYSNMIWWDKYKTKQNQDKKQVAKQAPKQAPPSKRGFPMFDRGNHQTNIGAFMERRKAEGKATCKADDNKADDARTIMERAIAAVHNRNYPSWN